MAELGEGLSGYLDVQDATLRAPRLEAVSNIGIANTAPQHAFSVGSNLYIDTESSNVLTVDGNVVCEGVKVGLIEIIPSYDLAAVSNVGNVTQSTIQFSNATTGFVTTANATIGNILTVEGNASINGNLSVTSNLEVGTANLFVDTTNSRVGVGTSIPTESLDVVGNMNLQQVSNTASIKLNSNVVTEFNRSKKLIKYPRVAMSQNDESGTSGYSIVQSPASIDPTETRKAWSLFNGVTVGGGGNTYHGTDGTTQWDGDGIYTGSESLGGVDGVWLYIHLPVKICLEFVKLTSRAALAQRTPRSGTFLGSNDGVNWTFLSSFSDIIIVDPSGSSSPEHTYTYDVNSITKYEYIGFVIERIGNTYPNFEELELYGIPEYDPEADGVDVVVKSVPNVPNTDWLEVYYDAKNYSGSGDVQDETANNRDAEMNATFDNGEIKAFNFSGAYTSNVTTSDHGLGTGDVTYTMSYWFKRTAVAGTYDYLVILGTGGTAYSSSLMWINNNQLTLDHWGSALRVLEPIVLDKWYHVVAGHRGGVTPSLTNDFIYINGKQVTPQITQTAAPFTLAGSKLTLGSSHYLTTEYFNGSIANFRLFNRALTSDEIYQLYAYQKEYFEHGDLGMTLKAGRLGIGTSEPRAALDVRGDVIAKGLREDAGRDYILSLAPNIWSVGGDYNDRITSGAINLGPHTFIQKVSGRSVWVMGAEDTYVDIMSVISSTDTTVTQAIALGLPMGVYKAGILANQIKGGTTTGNTNHAITYNASKAISYDNFSPGGGGITTTSTLDMSKESILVVRRNGNTASFWYNGVKFEEISYTETFNGTAPDRTRLGARDLVAVFNNTPIGLGFGAYAAWERALTDTEIRYLTYDKMTSI
jgi:hypothetical protein